VKCRANDLCVSSSEIGDITGARPQRHESVSRPHQIRRYVYSGMLARMAFNVEPKGLLWSSTSPVVGVRMQMDAT
jgi:hypothetical protein